MTPLRSTRFVGVLLGSLSLLAPDASAQAPASPAGEAVAAQARFDAGRSRFEAQDWAGAELEFRASLALYRSPNTLLYIGLCALRQNRVGEAFNTLSATVREAAQQARYESTRERAQRELEGLDGRVGRLTLRVVDPPADLSVRVRGEVVPVESLGEPQGYDPGEVEIVAEAPGFRTFRQSLLLAPGGLASIDVGMRRLGPVAPIRVVGPTAPPTVPAPMTRGGGVRTAGFVVGALSLAGFGIFVGFGLQAQSRYDDLIAACRGRRCPSTNVPAIDEGQQWQTLANVGLGMGVGLLVTGTIMVAVGGPRAALEAPSSRASVRLWSDPSRGMLGVAGAF